MPFHRSSLVTLDQYLTPVSLIPHHLASLWKSFSYVVVFASLEGDMQAQYRPSYRAPLESSLDEPRIGKTLAVYGLNKTVEPCQRVPFHVSIIQAEGEFINVAMQVLRAGMMVDAVHPALHYRPKNTAKKHVFFLPPPHSLSP